jgi:hypothetical protein
MTLPASGQIEMSQVRTSYPQPALSGNFDCNGARANPILRPYSGISVRIQLEVLMKLPIRSRIKKASISDDLSTGLTLLQEALSDEKVLRNKKLLELLEKANAYFVSAQNEVEAGPEEGYATNSRGQRVKVSIPPNTKREGL